MPDRTLVETKFLRFIDRDGWYFVERPHGGGVATIVAVTDEGKLILVEQPRPALAGFTIELPAGLAGDEPGNAGEALASAARRELLEETGYQADSLEELATCATAPGLSSELLTFFRARGLRKVGPGGGIESEQILVHEVPLGEVESFLRDKARAGLIVAAKVYAGLWFAIRP